MNELDHTEAPVRTLRADNLVKRYKKRTVVKGVSVDVRQGEVVGLLGPNGAGKTTTFYMIVGMIRPNEGSVFLDDTELTSVAMYRRARMGVGYLPQEASVFRKMTVEENILAVLQTMPLSKAERDERCRKLMEDFNITHIAGSMGYMLSGGERRRCEIARALATNPQFILLDEPFAGIDPIAVEEIMKIVAALKQRGIGVLVTDHNVHETLSITDRAYLLFDGSILMAGTAESLAADPEARKLYLGEKFKLDRY
jgi:lipopolysaccharide export system ATP-binding protein